jgi:hypothetical protein
MAFSCPWLACRTGLVWISNPQRGYSARARLNHLAALCRRMITAGERPG